MTDSSHGSQQVALWHEEANLLVAARRQGKQLECIPVELRPTMADYGFGGTQSQMRHQDRGFAETVRAMKLAGA